jgi:hypothetical protein
MDLVPGQWGQVGLGRNTLTNIAELPPNEVCFGQYPDVAARRTVLTAYRIFHP